MHLKFGIASVDHILASDLYISKDIKLKKSTMEELVNSQRRDPFCLEMLSNLNEGENCAFDIDDNSLIACILQANRQIVIPNSLKERSLTINRYLTIVGHLDGRNIYYRIKRHF